MVGGALETIEGSAIMRLVAQNSDGMRAESGENFLQTLCAKLGLRKRGYVECERVRVVLLELAARGSLRIVFESSDSMNIVALLPRPVDNSAAEIGRLKDEIGRLNTEVGQLLHKIEKDKATVETAEGIISVAETEVSSLRAECDELKAKLASAIAVNPRSGDRRYIQALERRIARRDGAILLLQEEIATLKQAASRKKKYGVKLTIGSQDEHRIGIGCGCIVERISWQACELPRRPDGQMHSFMSFATRDEEEFRSISAAIAELLKRQD